MTSPLVNQLLTSTADQRTERVLWIDPMGRGLFVIEVDAATALPAFREMTDVQALIEQDALLIRDDDPWLAPVSETGVPDDQKAKRDAAWALIEPLVKDQPSIFVMQSRGRAIRRVMVASGVTNQTLYRLLRRYWQRGMTRNALLPDYARCGAPGKERAITEQTKLKLVSNGYGNLVIDADVRSLFRAVITRRFATNKELDLSGAYEDLIRLHYSDSAIDEATGRQMLVPRARIPSPRQFRYWYVKDNDVFQIERIRRTPRVYDKDCRALLSSSTRETIGPGSRYQIDATIGDVYLVSRLNRNKIVGRPVVYIVIDVFSRMIVGVYIGFEGPSWVGAMMALANAATEKVTYCRQFGVEITDSDWPCHYLPDVLLGDRGEIAGNMIDTLINTLSVHVENAAPYRADWKGIVEQRFRMLPAKFKAYTPGYIADDFQERGGRDYRLDGLLDIDQFTRIIIHCILYYNNHHVIRGYDKLPEMIADGVPTVAIDLWEWGTARRSGTLRSFPPDLVKLSLLPSGEATVTAQGIRFYGCFFSCRKAIEEHWFERARQRGTWTVRVSYEPRCLDEIYLHDGTNPSRFVACNLTDRSRPYQGKTLWEIDQMRQEDRRIDRGQQHQALGGRINLTDMIEDVVAEAQAMKAASPAVLETDRQKIKRIRDNRRNERRSNQDREAFRFGPEASGERGGKVVPFTPNPPADEDYSFPSIADILNRLEDGGEDDKGRR
ncbi:Mu transposase C-terminal domain-containing protein [Azospirillum griseum]|uniref:Transposase n=1 Tax=Azospirillum griseum TaxID=2496639 RepID=A0A431V9N7_9PROT|nr:Mu transposase C-terminal domain-containing protein [Azospirillum griseum]RTR12003.1 transposase [Azospirillum griseum]